MRVKCITFDLDDTLWDCGPVMARAEEVFYDWLGANYPRIPSRYSLDELADHRFAYFAGRPAMHHDLTRLRKQWIWAVALEVGYGSDVVESGFDVFWRARNDVQLYREAMGTLKWVQRLYRVGAITNGNADVHTIGIGHYFNFVVTAAEAGAAKPHPQIFEAALEAARVCAEEAVHVGDDPERDVAGAAAVGMRTVWLNPTMAPWPGGLGPDAVIESLDSLPDVLQSWEQTA